MLNLEALVAASRETAISGSADDAALRTLRLADVAAHAGAVLSAVRQQRQQLAAARSHQPAAEPEDDPQLAAQQQELLLCFRVMRNAAAAGAGAAQAVLSAGLLQLASEALDLLASAAIPLNWQLPAAVAQALANLCTASGAGATAAWSALFPLRLSMLAHVNAGATQAATCLALLACCRAVEGAAAALAGEQGAQLMTALLCNHQRMLQQGEHNDALGLLAAHLCFSRDLLPQLFASLGPSLSTQELEGGGTGSASNDGSGPAGGGSTAAGQLSFPGQQPTMAQVTLLELLCSEAHDMPQAPGGAGNAASSSGRQRASMRFLTDLAQSLAAASKPAAGAGGLSAGQQQLLQDSLHLMRDICARDDSGRGLVGSSGGSNGGSIEGCPASAADLVAELQAAGALPALLAMLKALDPIRSPQQQRQAAEQGQVGAGQGPGPGSAAGADSSQAGKASGSGTASGGIQLAELAPQLAEQAARFPSQQPYPGFRSDLLAALANAAHGRPSVQEEVGRLGGVELVLAQCQLDRESPLAREWGLWAVRNLCEGNPQAQEAIRQLQLCTTVESEELQRLGVKLELDEQTGKLRVTKRQGPAAAAGEDGSAASGAPPA